MADPHELGPESPCNDSLTQRPEFTQGYGDCTDCHGLIGELLTYLEDNADHGTPFSVNKDNRDRLVDILRQSPELEALAIEIRSQRLCPIVLLRSEHLEKVKHSFPIGMCVSLDLYRPGIQLQEFPSPETPPELHHTD